MSGKYLLDTNAIINILKNDNERFWDKFEKIVDECKVAIISEMEILAYSKLTKKEEKMIREFLSNYEVININELIKEKAIYLRKEFNFKLPDAIICATAFVRDLLLVTDDKALHKLDDIEVMGLLGFMEEI